MNIESANIDINIILFFGFFWDDINLNGNMSYYLRDSIFLKKAKVFFKSKIEIESQCSKFMNFRVTNCYSTSHCPYKLHKYVTIKFGCVCVVKDKQSEISSYLPMYHTQQ